MCVFTLVWVTRVYFQVFKVLVSERVFHSNKVEKIEYLNICALILQVMFAYHVVASRFHINARTVETPS